MCAVRERIEDLGELNFQNSVGVNSDNLLTLLDFYLHSTAINSDGQFYIQRTGICICSAIAPIFGEIFLSSVDNEISAKMVHTPVTRVFRY